MRNLLFYRRDEPSPPHTILSGRVTTRIFIAHLVQFSLHAADPIIMGCCLFSLLHSLKKKNACLCWDPKRKKEEIKKLGQGMSGFSWSPFQVEFWSERISKPTPSPSPNSFPVPPTSFPILRFLGDVSVISPPQYPTWPCSPVIHIHPAFRGPLNPEETCSYFLGGNFDLQEFCFSGQHLPRGMYPDKDGSLAFIL